MFGSDWPVALLAVDYANWVGTVESLPPTNRVRTGSPVGETAIEAYAN